MRVVLTCIDLNFKIMHEKNQFAQVTNYILQRRFKTKISFCVSAFAQLAERQSLRDTVTALKTMKSKLSSYWNTFPDMFYRSSA